MAKLTIRSIDAELKEALEARAAKNKRSTEAEARAILKDVLKPEGFSVARFRKAIKGLEVDLPLPPRSRAILEEVKRAPIKEENFAAWVRERFKGLEVELDIPPREYSRPPPDFG